MKKASDYLLHAQECRVLAAQMDSADALQQMLQMAQHWEQLALDRSDLVERHPELDHARKRETPSSGSSRRNEAKNDA